MDASKDYYLILEVHPQASPEMIERAKRLLLQRYHPDHNPDRPEWAAEQTRRVLEAYAILSDPRRRAEYDRVRALASASQGGASSSPSPRPASRSASPRAGDAVRAYRAASQATTAQRPSRVDPIRENLPRGVRVVACQNCGRSSRIPPGVALHRVRCGACREPIRLSFGERMRRLLARTDARLDRASDALRRLLIGKPAKRSPKEKSSR